MKRKQLFKDVFSLAVKISGLYFFCVGLKALDAPAFMDMTTIRCDSLNDIISAVLPVVFNLSVAWWLLGSQFLTLRAYPEKADIVNHTKPDEEKPAPPEPDHAKILTGVEMADEKLSALVRKPKGDQPVK